MCGRYTIGDAADNDEMLEIIDAINRRSPNDSLKTSGEIRPTDTAPVIATSRAQKPSAFAMSWGYSLPDGKRIINARSESAEGRPLFHDGMLQRRCAVPAISYFEWERSRPQKTKYAIRPVDAGLMYMAGIYRIESGLPVFAILTREPAEHISFIHNRMPVILPPDLISGWINPKYRAGDILSSAVLDVQYAKVGESQWEQIGMEL